MLKSLQTQNMVLQESMFVFQADLTHTFLWKSGLSSSLHFLSEELNPVSKFQKTWSQQEKKHKTHTIKWLIVDTFLQILWRKRAGKQKNAAASLQQMEHTCCPAGKCHWRKWAEPWRA